MNSWRKIVLDVLNGVDKDTGESVSEAINRCRCEPPAESSGSLSEAIKNLAQDKKKIKEKVRALDKQLRVLQRWVDSMDRQWEYPPEKMTNALIRVENLLDDIYMGDEYTEKMLQRLQTAFDKADSIISPVKKAEEEKEAKYNKTPCGKIFQELVFGWKRGKGEREVEPNTDEEDIIKDNVGEYIGGNEVNARSKKAMQQLKACVKQYPDQLRPTVTHAWRGISIESSRSAMGFIPLNALLKSKDRLQIGNGTFIGVKGTYKPKREIESWAAEPKIAYEFASQGSGGFSRPHTLLASVVADAKKLMSGRVAPTTFVSSQDIALEFSETYDELMGVGLTVIYYIKIDKDFIFSEWFADLLAQSQGVGEESEVSHVVEERTAKPATIYINAGWVDAVNYYNEKVRELREVMGDKMPKKIKEITFE